ncbi:MAG: winged helix-turn-helix transcriptional regulator [Thermoplasmata archaeon]
MKLESLDLRILQALLEDGRASFREVAGKVGASTPTISARVKELEALGVIEGYQAVVRPEKLEGSSLFLRVRTEPGALEEVVRDLKSKEEVRQLYMASRFNLLIRATFMSSEDVRDFLRWVSGLAGVAEYEDFTLLRTFKEESPVLIREGASLTINCFYCGKRITERPIRLRLDDRYHYLCCTSCADLYREKYQRIRSAA